MRSIRYIIPVILLTILTGCTKTGPDNPVRDDVTVHWAISPGGLGDMGYNDIIFGGISAAASRYDFGLYYYRPESAEEMVPVVEQWASEPQADGTRSLFVLGASDYEVTVHTIGIVAMSAAYLAGCVADSLSDPQSLAAAEAFCLGADPEHPDSVTVIELSDGYSGFYMADSLYRMCPDLTARYDFFFPYAGGTALGMYRYMRDYSGPWMVVGMDQSDLAPDNMCCSMIKRIDRAIVLWMDSYIRGEEIPLRTIHGMESGLISLSPSEGYETLIEDVTARHRNRALEIEQIYTEILSSR